jgi:hypothetical protein
MRLLAARYFVTPEVQWQIGGVRIMRDVKNSAIKLLAYFQLCGLLLLTLCAFNVEAQTIVGRISGTVKDPTGAAVPNAAVAVTNKATNLVRTATTDESGFYTVTNLPAGTYTIELRTTTLCSSTRRNERVTC